MSISQRHTPLRVLYEDNHILVVDKEPGLPTQGRTAGDDCLLERCRDYIRESRAKPGDAFIGMVHRLDLQVGGVMVFALTSKAASRLSAVIRERTFAKTYNAVVEGMLHDSGTFEDRVLREGSRTVVVDKPDAGRSAVLDYKIIAATKRATEVEINLHTGRKHQIRAQFTHRGHPIVGDRRYGSTTSIGPHRIALISRSLSFKHPTRDEVLTFSIDLPDWWPSVG